MKNAICPLCLNTECKIFFQDKSRDYFQCSGCCLIFVPPHWFLAEEAEKSEYDLHNNDPYDQGYRKFLSRLFVPMQERIAPGSHGLDFGSGPGPTLSLMFQESGHIMKIYDKFYAKNPHVLEKQYDFITATEVVEHLHSPQKTLDMVWKCLKIGGWLGIMTKLTAGKTAFRRWHYKNDFTHVCFFSRDTFRWVAARWQADLVFAGKDVILYQKLK